MILPEGNTSYQHLSQVRASYPEFSGLTLWSDKRIGIMSEGIYTYTEIYDTASDSLQNLLYLPKILDVFAGIAPTTFIKTSFSPIKEPYFFPSPIPYTDTEINELQFLTSKSNSHIQVLDMSFPSHKDNIQRTVLINTKALVQVVRDNREFFNGVQGFSDDLDDEEIYNWFIDNPLWWNCISGGHTNDDYKRHIISGLVSGFPFEASEKYARGVTIDPDYFSTSPPLSFYGFNENPNLSSSLNFLHFDEDDRLWAEVALYLRRTFAGMCGLHQK